MIDTYTVEGQWWWRCPDCDETSPRGYMTREAAEAEAETRHDCENGEFFHDPGYGADPYMSTHLTTRRK